MAIAFTAWLTAPAPIACTSTRPLLRITPAIAPATATGLEVAETFSTSTGTRPSTVIAGTPSNLFSVDLLDRRGSAGRGANGNQHRVESHRPGGHHKPVRNDRQKALQNDLFVHPDAPVPGADHAHVGDVSRTPRQDPCVSGWDVGVRADHGADPAFEVPAHGRLLRGRLGVHVAEGDLHVRVGGQDRVRGAEWIVQGLEKDPADEVYDQDLVPAGLDHAPAPSSPIRRG